ncbi:MAG: leucine-rich repeat protein [Bacillota bacterium]
MNGKRKKPGRVWAIITALALLVQMLAPAAAHAAETYTDPDGNTYTYVIGGDGKATITDFTLEDPGLPDITIPEAFNGHPVTKIGTRAFYGNGLASVVIPGSVQIIAQEAFASNYISMLVIPSGVTSIESMAFAENDIASLEIPGNVTSIGTYAFSTNILTSLSIRDGVAEIGAAAFENNRLTSVTIPASVTSIGQGAFFTNQLTDVTIYNSTAAIDDDVFDNNQSSPEDLTIHGYTGSTAQTYADAKGHAFAALGGGGGDFGGGAGTPEDPYIISSEAHLQEMAAKVNDAVTNAVYGSAYYVQTADITMTPPAPDGSNHTPIGTAACKFSGYFDGQNKTISGLVFKHSVTAGENFGLFGYVGTGGVVRNTLVTSSSMEGNFNVGGIVGYNEGIITACSFDGSVKGHSSRVGGIAGDNAGEISNSGFSGSVSSPSFAVGGIAGYNGGTVETVSFAGSVTGLWFVGGIVGANGGEINSGNNDGDVTGSRYAIGGVAGTNQPTGIIRNSGNSGNVYGPDVVGGVSGENEGLIEYSHNKGNVSGLNDPYSGTGGIAGGSWAGTIQYCYNLGTVSGKEYVGGLVGESGADIEYSYNLGNVIGTDFVGGLVGSSYDGSITRSYAVGAVTGTGINLGGLVGKITDTTITSSYYDSETTGRSDTGKGEPKTTAEMKTQATFAGWDFTNTWAIVNTATHWSYPHLRWYGFNETEAPGYSLKPQGGGGYSEYEGADGNTYYFVDNGDGTATITGLDDSGDYSTDITIPDTVDGLEITKIGDNAFMGIGLTKVTIPASVTEIGASAFEGNLLTGVTIPSGVTNIGDSTFNSNHISSAIILSGSLSIGADAFAGNQDVSGNLRIYGYTGSGAQTYADSDGHTFAALDPTGGGIVTGGDGNIYIYTANDDGVTATIAGFAGGGSSDIEIPGIVNGLAVTRIGEAAFRNKAITGVIIPEGVTEIGDKAFIGYDDDEEDYIYRSSQWDPTNRLASVTIPASVASIGEKAFSAQGYFDEDGYYINTLTEAVFEGGENSGLETIGDSAFRYNALESVTIPQNVQSIEELAFASQYNNDYEQSPTLTDVTIESSTAVIGDNVFDYNQSDPADLIIYGYAGSTAEAYATDKGHTFAAIATPAGDGSENDPYLVSSAANLVWMSLTNNANNGFEDKYFKQTAYIDMSGISNFIPIGDLSNAFMGHYDGHGHKIINLTVDVTTEMAGLFGVIGITGEVKGLTLENVSINIASNGDASAGGIAGANMGKISGCHIKVSGGADSSISAGGTRSVFIGGIAGFNMGSISQSSNAAEIRLLSGADGITGGIAGGDDSGSIDNCFNTGKINNAGGNYTILASGGILGRSLSTTGITASYCISTAEISVADSGTSISIVGGIQGLTNTDNIESCFFLAGTAAAGYNILAGDMQFAPSSVGAAAKTLAELKTPSTFTGWDIDVWVLASGSLPRLKSQTLAHTVEPDGDGTESSPYLIASAGNLVWMSEENEAAEGFAGEYFRLTEDIDLSTVSNYQPIGDDSSPFKGKFDGNDHTISNLKIGDSEDPASFSYTGLFGYVYQGEIKGLTLEDVEIYCASSHAGGLVGRIAGGLISNVRVNGAITNTSSGGSAGGLIGTIGMENSAGETKVEDCSSDIEVVSAGDAGGFVGRVESEEVTIDTCVSTGNVAGGDNAKTGGFAGGNFGTILNSSASGNVTGGNGHFTFAGGFAGENGGMPLTIKNSFARGNVTGGDNAKVGGFVGFNSKRVLNAYATGNVTGGTNAVLGGFAAENWDEGELINTYHNSTVFTDAVGQGEGKRTFSAGITQANMTAATNQPGALVDILNANRGSNSDWLQWTIMPGANDNYPVFGSSAPSTPATGSGSEPTSAPTPGIPIMVNGQTQQQAAIASTQNQDGKTVTIVTLDTHKTVTLVNANTIGSTVTIPINNAAADVVVGQLSGDLVKAMESREAVIEIKTNNASYTMPAQQINIEAVLAQLGQDVKLSDVKLNIEIAKTTGEMARIVEDTASKGNFTIVVPPLSFTVKATYGDKTLDVSKFNSYVERTLAIPDGVDPSKITTGIVVEPDGTVRHVPTQIIVIDGKYYAKINSLTNSTYSVIWNPMEFSDVENHWAKEAVNDMGSRMVVSGVGNDMFAPDRDITRAEFAAIIVRALGLKPGTGGNPFADVSNTAWYCDYIKTAVEYKIISGYGDGKFGPSDKITREQAMSMAARAMNITGLKVQFADGEMDKLHASFGDAANSADYAKNSIAACVKTGIVSGRNGNMIAPKDNITRAEVAVILQRLLQKSGLI